MLILTPIRSSLRARTQDRNQAAKDARVVNETGTTIMEVMVSSALILLALAMFTSSVKSFRLLRDFTKISRIELQGFRNSIQQHVLPSMGQISFGTVSVDSSYTCTDHSSIAECELSRSRGVAPKPVSILPGAAFR